MKLGDNLGPYRVLGKLGEGGMGEVYRARDTQLGRERRDQGPARALRRAIPSGWRASTREAQTLAALNHPNIAHIYGLEGDGSPERPRGAGHGAGRGRGPVDA